MVKLHLPHHCSSEDLDKILTTSPKYGIEIIPPPPQQ